MGHSLSCSGISRRDEDGWLSNAVLSAGVVRPGPGFQILIDYRLDIRLLDRKGLAP